MWLALAIGFVKRYNLMKNATWQLIIVSVGCILWDVFTGWHGWSVDYVLPAVCMVILLSMFIITKVQRNTAREYMIYFVMAAGAASADSAADWRGEVPACVFHLCGGVLFVSGGPCYL